MVAIRIGPDLKLIAVASPSYLKANGSPETPHDLVKHKCINLRLSSQRVLYAWEFEKDGRPLRVRVDGQLIFNTIRPTVTAARAGYGIAFVPDDSLDDHLARGALVQVLEDWCPPISGFHLYYPSRRQTSPAFQVIANALRHAA